MNKTKDVRSYKDLKLALDEILVKLQNPDTGLDEAVKLHAEGQEILNQIDTYLKHIADKNEIKFKKID